MEIIKGFKSCAKNVKHKLSGEPLADALLVQTAIASFYETMKNSPKIQIIGLAASGWMPETIFKEECNRALKNYLG